MNVPLSEPLPGHEPEREVRAAVAATVRLYREGIASRLERCPGVRVVAVAADARETLAAAALAPDVVLLDVSMPDALALVREIGRTRPEVKVVAFAVDDAHEEVILACVEAGVAGWVGRDGTLEDVLDAVVRAAHGELLCSARMAALLSRRVAALVASRGSAPAPGQLTPRESEIGALLSRGLSNKHIARTLSLQLATVKNHVHKILEKLNVRTRGEAAALLRGSATVGSERGEY
jgi:two-component system, NarL family, nitrate/nitrite response regulator NarL